MEEQIGINCYPKLIKYLTIPCLEPIQSLVSNIPLMKYSEQEIVSTPRITSTNALNRRRDWNTVFLCTFPAFNSCYEYSHLCRVILSDKQSQVIVKKSSLDEKNLILRWFALFVQGMTSRDSSVRRSRGRDVNIRSLLRLKAIIQESFSSLESVSPLARWLMMSCLSVAQFMLNWHLSMRD